MKIDRFTLIKELFVVTLPFFKSFQRIGKCLETRISTHFLTNL